MENFDTENIDELLEIRQIRQYFPPSKFCAVQYINKKMLSLLVQKLLGDLYLVKCVCINQ